MIQTLKTNLTNCILQPINNVTPYKEVGFIPVILLKKIIQYDPQIVKIDVKIHIN